MRLELDGYSAICETKTFVINGIKADYKDFGEKFDSSPESAKPYRCGNMVFEPKVPAKQVLDKYRITKNEYKTICECLRSCMSFGACRLCG